jgi:hypothetical protein
MFCQIWNSYVTNFGPGSFVVGAFALCLQLANLARSSATFEVRIVELALQLLSSANLTHPDVFNHHESANTALSCINA